MAEEKILLAPHSKEAEMMVLGSMLNSSQASRIGVELLRPSDFFVNEHQTVHLILHELFKKEKPVDVHTVCEDLKKINKLKEVGGAGYITTLAQYAGTSAHIEEYCNTVRTHAFTRQQIELSQNFCKELIIGKENSFALTEKYHQKSALISKRYATEDRLTLGAVLDGSKSSVDKAPLIERLKQRQEFFQASGKHFSTGIPTGFIDLDAKTSLLEDTHLVIIAGRPSMGKTTLALNIAENVSLIQKIPVAIFTLEMGADQLAEKIISSQSGVSLTKMKQGTFSKAEFRNIESTINTVSSAPLYIYDQGAATISNIVAKARQLKEKEKIGLMIVDYLQLLGVDGGGDSRQYEVAEVSRRLKLLAMELQIPIICVAQLSRKVEERTEKRPLMSDLRDSGQIEQDADAIVFLFRRDYYNKNESPGQAEVIIAKNRHGPTDTVHLSFQQENGRFANLAPTSRKMIISKGEF